MTTGSKTLLIPSFDMLRTGFTKEGDGERDRDLKLILHYARIIRERKRNRNNAENTTLPAAGQ
jgi:hypothetical protein